MPEKPSQPLEHELVYAPMTLDQVREAYQRGDHEALNAWYLERHRVADLDPTSGGRFEISVDLARIHHAAGDADTALETISGVSEAIQQELIELDRHDSPLAGMPGKDAYMSRLKTMLQQVVYLREEFRR